VMKEGASINVLRVESYAHMVSSLSVNAYFP
jgi:hypothetical protein